MIYQISLCKALQESFAENDFSCCAKDSREDKMERTIHVEAFGENEMMQSPYKSAQDAAGKDRMKRYSEEDLSSTQYFKVKPDQESGTRKVLSIVYEALTKKGYDPVNQIVGYIMSGDPTYITSHKGARSLIMKVERDELVEELLRVYVEKTVKE